MDEIAKTEARNYLSAAGFFLIAAWYILALILNIGHQSFLEPIDKLLLVLGIAMLIVATLLVVLHKRDMVAILFFLMGFFMLFAAFTPFGMMNFILISFMVLVMLVTLTGQDKKKWLLFLIPLIAILFNLAIFTGFNFALLLPIAMIIASVICLYYAFCCACERISLPGAKILTADAMTDFKASGSVLGYMLFALLSGGYALHYILGEAVLPIATFQIVELIGGALMVLIAILLLTVGKMRFTPVMFLLLGLTNILMVYSSGAMYFGIGILWLVIGLFCILRKESRILPGIMLIVYAGTAIFSGYATGVSISAPVVSIILNAIPCLIAIYLAFVVYSQRKLPKF